MADQFLSLLDITARRGTDAAVGLVEEVVTYAPEVEKIMGRPVPGNFYTARVRTAIASGGAFRASNGGTGISASRFVQKRFDCFTFDSELQVDEVDIKAAESAGDSSAMVQADEANAVLRDKAIKVGQQFYAGTSIDTNGHPGLIDFVNTTQVFDAGGSAAGKCEVAWFFWMHPQGVHFIFGGNQGLDVKPWTLQQVPVFNSAGAQTGWRYAWCSNINGLIGLSCAHVRAVGAVKNIDNTLTNDTEAKALTDKLCWDVYHAFPVGLKPTFCAMSRATCRGLQKQRAVTIFGNAGNRSGGTVGNIADLPATVCGDIPILVTDSILAGNANPF